MSSNILRVSSERKIGMRMDKSLMGKQKDFLMWQKLAPHS